VPTVAETAYPRLKNQVKEKELTEIYTPTPEELNLASLHTRKGATKLEFLVLLKTFQRLGYFVAPTTVSSAIVKHIANCSALACPPDVFKSYDTSGTRWRHIIIIRNYLAINPYQAQARKLIVKSMVEVSESVEELKHRWHHAVTPSTKERVQMLYWIKQGAIAKRKELSQKLARDESTIYRWLKKSCQGGISNLL
jgi:Domain of unknown function (DUF4158)